MKMILAIVAVMAASFMVLPGQNKKATQADRADDVNRSMKVRVHVKGNEKWSLLDDLQDSARQAIDQREANVQWKQLKEINAWIDPENLTNVVMFHFSFGFGNRGFLVSFGKDGLLTQYNAGNEMDSVVPPPYQEFTPHR